ncbi:MAG TPA: hypothetical protein PLK94_06495 [Alphaproteobacteria bacterium]|nr:hypothetical protein [Alphaproteobacteria bacterium]
MSTQYKVTALEFYYAALPEDGLFFTREVPINFIQVNIKPSERQSALQGIHITVEQPLTSEIPKFYMAEEMQALQDSLTESFKNESVAIYGADDDEQDFLIKLHIEFNPRLQQVVQTLSPRELSYELIELNNNPHRTGNYMVLARATLPKDECSVVRIFTGAAQHEFVVPMPTYHVRNALDRPEQQGSKLVFNFNDDHFSGKVAERTDNLTDELWAQTLRSMATLEPFMTP